MMLRPVKPVLCLVMVCGIAVGACTRVPEIEDQITPDLRGAPYPALVPLEGALQEQVSPSQEGQALDAELKARAARLKARAARLNAIGG